MLYAQQAHEDRPKAGSKKAMESFDSPPPPMQYTTRLEAGLCSYF
jgi:hypothetical protein